MERIPLSLWKENTPMLRRGFTLIELLVVIAIIALLSTIALSSYSTVRQKAKTTRRAADLRTLRSSLELYYSDFGSYPNSSNAWRSECTAYGGQTGVNVIPGLVPAYIQAMPRDPDMNISAGTCCYLYYSDGVNYKILDHACSTINYPQVLSLVDPARDGGSNACLVDGTGYWSLWTTNNPGATCAW